MQRLSRFFRRQRVGIYALTLLQAFFMAGGAEAVEARQQGILRAQAEDARMARTFGLTAEQWHVDAPPSWIERSANVVVEEAQEILDHSRTEVAVLLDEIRGPESPVASAHLVQSVAQAVAQEGGPVGQGLSAEAKPKRQVKPYIPRRAALEAGEGERTTAPRLLSAAEKSSQGLNAEASALPLHVVQRQAQTVDAGALPPSQRISSAIAPASPRARGLKTNKAIAPEIVALAASLDNSPAKIFRYVHDQITYDPKWGVDSTPLGTLWEGRGTSWDQAWLLQELLTAAGIDARLEWGQVEIPPSLLTNLTGIDDPIRAGDFLTTAGLEVLLVIQGSQVSAARFPHVWVKAHLDYIPNRGVTPGTPDTWIRMDPSITIHERTDGLRLDQDLPFMLGDHLLSGTELSPRQDYEAALLTHVADQGLPVASLDDAKSLQTQVADEFPFVPGTLRAKIVGAAGESETVPAAFEQDVEIQIREEGGGALLTWTTTASAIYGKRLETVWLGATSSDQAALDLYGGIFATPPYEVELRPTLRLDGVEVASGSGSAGSIGSAEDAEIQLRLTPPDGSGAGDGIATVAGWDLFAGEHGVLSLDYGRAPTELADRFAQEALSAAGNTFETEGWQLAQAASTYLNALGGDLTHLVDLSWHRLLTFNTAVFAVKRGAVSTSPDGTPQTFSPGPLSLDVGAMPLAVMPVDGVQTSTVPTLELLGSQGSFREGEALASVFGGEHLTAVTFLTRAVREGQVVTKVDLTNLNDALAAAEISGDAKGAIRYAVEQLGMEAWISETQIESNTFQTTGYILIDPSTGSGGYFVTFERRFTPLDGAVTFHNPIDLDVITAPTDVIASIDAEGIESWTLSTRPVGGSGSTVIATGTGPVDNTVLGRFDPTLLLNGMHDIVLTGQNAAGEPVTGKVTVSVEGNMKIGYFTLSFIDLAVPLAGLDIQIVRTYDSRRRQEQGDFGFGWTLDIRQGSYRNNRSPGDGWQILPSEGPFGLPCQQVTETKSHLTTIRLSDQELYRFRTKLTRPATVIGGCYADAVFELVDGPMPGARLEVIGNNEVIYQVETDRAIDRHSLEIFEPQNVRLTTPDGRVFVLDLDQGVTELEDKNGNALQITPAGISHSSGQSIDFERDAEGRIVRIEDPLGETMTYTYDSEGDHTGFEDRTGETTGFTYTLDHYLQEIENAAGVRAVRTEYDAEGRMVRLIDGLGNEQVFDHDLEGRREVVTNRLGFVQVLEYDLRGNVIRRIDEAGGETLFTYNGDDQLLSEADPLGYQIQYGYDVNGFLSSITDSLGRATTLVYDEGGRLLQETSADGEVASYAYDSQGNLTAATDRIGHITQFVYSGIGEVIREIDALGHEVVREYDGTGALIRVEPPLGSNMALTYDDAGNLLTLTRTVTRPDGTAEQRVDSWQYDTAGRELVHTAADGAVQRRTYGTSGNIETLTDPLGRVTRFEYDLQGRKTLVQHPDGSTEAVDYDAEGQPVRWTDRAGRQTTVTYDPVGRPLTMTYPDGTVSRIEYDAGGRRTATVNGLGHRTEMTYDLSGRLTQVTDALGNSRSMIYDAGGRLRRAENARGFGVEFEYDGEGRSTRLTYPDGTTQEVVYDALGQRISETDRSGQATTATFDALGQLTQVTDALGQTVDLEYDGFGQRISQTDANGHTTLFEYDVVGRLTARTLPGGERESMQYLADGSLSRHEAFDGVARTFDYDTSARLVRHQTGPLDTVDVTYTPTGRVASLADDSGTLSFTYDTRDRLIEKVDPNGHRLSYAYDANGNPTLLEANIGSATYSTGYVYDAVNRLVTVNDSLGGATTVGYDANGNRTSIQYPNGAQKTLTYDGLDQLTAIEALDGSGQTLDRFQYLLGPGGRRTRLETLTATHDYAYDALHRLVGETTSDLSGNVLQQVNFTYDALGNRLETTTDGIPSAAGFDVNDQQLTSGDQTFTWDGRGRLVSRGTVGSQDQFTWNHRDQLTSAVLADGTDVQYRYDAEGNWVGQTTTELGEAAQSVDFVIDTRGGRSQIVAEVVAGQVEAYYTRLDHQLLSLSNPQDGTRRYSLFDGQGSIRSLMDDQGIITDRYDYNGYGELVSHLGDSPNPYRYVGERQDPHSGLYHLRARWMDPKQGRFLSIDPAFGDVQRPLSLNRYLYSEADPVHRMDPLGLESFLNISFANAIRGVLGAINTFMLHIYRAMMINVGRATLFFINNSARIEIAALLGTIAFAFIDVGTRYILNNIEIVPVGPNEPGEFVERKMGANMTEYRNIDDLRDETATSIKTREAPSEKNLLKNIRKDAQELGKLERFKPKKEFRGQLPIIPASQVKNRVLFVVIPETRVHIAVSPSFIRTVRQIQEANRVIIRVIPLKRWKK